MLSYSYIMLLMIFTVGIFTGIGVLYSKGKISTTDDFLTARGSTGTKTLSATLMASFLGVFLLFTPPEAGILGGLPAIIGYAMGVASLYGAFIVLSPKVRNYLPEGSTLTDYAWKRYGKKMYGLTVILSLFYMLVHLVAELTAIGMVASQLAGIPLIHTTLLVGFGTMIYTAYGGLRASMFTDLIQMIFVGILLVGVTAGFIYYGGGTHTIFTRIGTNTPQLLSLSNWGGIQYGLTLCIAVFAANLFHQGYWQRIYAGRNNEILHKSLKSSILLVVPIMLLTGFLGILAGAFHAGDNPSIAVFTLASSLFPKAFIIGLFLLALVLVMSTVDTLLNGIVATFTIDGRRLFKQLKEESVLPFARTITILLMIPAAILAAKGYSVLYLFFVADLVCAGVFFPLFYGLFSSRCNEKTALWSALLGIGSGIPFFVAGKLLWSFLTPVVVSGGICLLAVRYQKEKIETVQ
ncbi:Na+/proline symporter [Geosporobacter subterraneus DSM 17957]|uniref:Na+/proline symporter n=1 Tax=Geosporobacter subterraneus DSM 17957 TaxID=1121919 RepID=A0A1M6LAM6_9FIRM|nr:hypothetical protein [Geosporobacter subterraneus]SHJ68261.1 Na+/proline symporter [Geosporobacter subterraneus DSM 17957]